MEPVQKAGLKQKMLVNTGHYIAVGNRHTQNERHKRIEHDDTNRKAHDLKGEVKTDAKRNTYSDKLIGMINEYEFMRMVIYDGQASQTTPLN